LDLRRAASETGDGRWLEERLSPIGPFGYAQGRLAGATVSPLALSGRSHPRYTQVLQRAVDHGLEFVGIFDFAALS